MAAPELFVSPPTMQDTESSARAWIFDSLPCVVDQVTGADLGIREALWLTGTMEAEIARRHGDHGRMVEYVHDWRTVRTYSQEARDLLMKWGRRARHHTSQATIGISPQASPFVLIAASTATVILRGLRLNIAIVPNIEAVLVRIRSKLASS